MASVTISGLPTTTTVDPTNAAIPVTNAGTTYKASPTVLIGSALGSPPAIGNTTPNTGAFTTMSVSGTFTLSGGQLIPVANGGTGAGTAAGARGNLGLGTIATQASSNVAITGGTVDGTTIGGNTPTNGTFTGLNATSFITTPIIQPKDTGGIQIEDASNNQIAVFGASNTLNTTISPANGTVTISPSGTGNVVVAPAGSSSTMDNVTIGATTPRSGTFSTGQFNTSVYTNLVRPVGSSALSFYNSTGTAQLSIAANGGVNMTGNHGVNISPTGTIGNVVINPATGGGNMDNVVIGATTPVAGTFTTLTANSTVNLSPANGVVNLSPQGTVGGVIIYPEAGGTLDNVLIGGTQPAAGTFTSGTFTSLATTSGTVSNAPVSTTDIANKAYVDSVAVGLQPKAPVKCLAASPITLSGLQTIDGYTTLAGDRVIVTGQADATTNGIYAASATAWTRTTDANTWDLLIAAFAQVLNGTLYKGTGWVSNAEAGGTLGITNLEFFPLTATQFYTAGTGLDLNGNQFNISTTGVTAGTYGSASSIPVITVNAEGQITAATGETVNITLSDISNAGTMAGQNATAVAVTGGSVDGTTIGGTTPAAGTFTTSSAAHAYIGTFAGTPGTIEVNGTSYTTNSSISDIDGTDVAQVLLQSHNTAQEVILATALSKSATTAYAPVTNGESVFSILPTASTDTTANFHQFGAITFAADDTGTISATSSPSKLQFITTPDGSVTGAEQMAINNAGAVSFQGNFGTAGEVLVSGGDTGAPKYTSSMVWNGVANVFNTGTNFTNLTGGNLVYFVGDNTVSTGPQLTIGVNEAATAVGINYSEVSGASGAELIFSSGGSAVWIMAASGDFIPRQGTTTMTSGFVYIPAAAGAPTGTPLGATGAVPMYYDTTDNKLYIYSGGAWKSSTFS